MIFLIGLSCTTDEIITPSMVGEWEIAWNFDLMTTMGQIEFSENGNAEVTTISSQNDLLTPGSHQAFFNWQLTPDELILERLDNGLQLSYEIVSASDRILELTYADEIQIMLVRMQ